MIFNINIILYISKITMYVTILVSEYIWNHRKACFYGVVSYSSFENMQQEVINTCNILNPSARSNSLGMAAHFSPCCPSFSIKIINQQKRTRV